MLNKTLKMTLSELILIVMLTHLIVHMLRRVNVDEFIKGMLGVHTYTRDGLHK